MHAALVPSPGGPPEVRESPAPLPVLTAGLALAAGAAAGGTLLWDGVLLGPPAMNGSARGTALVVLVVALPLLLGSAWLGRRGSARAAVVRLGATGYLAYNAVLFLFGTPFNRLFLAYVLMLGLSVAALGATVLHLRARPGATRFRQDGWTRAVAAYAGLVVLLNALAWLKNVVPALGHPESAGFLAGTGLTTSPVYVQDLALWLPLAAVLAHRLWRRQSWGVVGTGAVLVMWTIESISIAVDQAFGAHADPSSPAVSGAVVVPFLVLAALGLVPLAVLLRRPGP